MSDKPEALRLAKVLRDMCENGAPIGDLWTTDQPDGDPFVMRAAELLESLHAFGEQVNAIRNSIIGLQRINWSEHIYPLVAALDEAGFVGLNYDTARANVGTLIERANKAEAECERLRADAERYRWLRATTNFAANSAGERIDVRNKPDLWDAAIDAARTEQA